jgi:tetratricopeptide (TPR) repeat protein
MVDVGHLGCVRSGLCCQRAPCAYGEPAEDGNGCRYLEIDVQRAGATTYRCGRYEWIVANVADWRTHPAFGAGCSAPLFNPNRDALLRAQGLDSRLPAVPSEAELARVFTQARDCQESNRLAEAEALYRGILVARPNHAASLYRLGQIARRANLRDYAVWLFERAIAAGADDALLHAERGEVLQLDKQFERAADSFAQAAAAAPDDPSHRIRQAAALTAAGRPADAALLLQALLAVHPESAAARWTLALAERALARSPPERLAKT